MTDALATLERGAFTPLLGEILEVRDPSTGQAVSSVKLIESSTLPHGRPDRREPFSLILEGPASEGLQQGTYLFCNPRIGELPIFIVPVSERDGARRYQAVFN